MKDYVKTDLQTGENAVTVGNFASLFFYPAEGHVLTSVRRGDNGREVYEDMHKASYAEGEAYVTNAGANLADVYYVDTKPEGSLETATFTVNIDRVPAGMECYLTGSYADVSLKPGANTVTYTPTLEKRLVIRNPDLQEFYQVKLNGVAMESSFIHYLDLTPGCTIDVLCDFPDETFTYNIIYHDEEGFWTDIVVDGTPVFPENNQFKAKYGAKVQMYCRDAEKWYVLNITDPNGVVYEGGYTGNEYLEVTGDTPFEFTALKPGSMQMTGHRLKDYNVTFHIDGVEHVQIFHGSENITGTPFTGLKDGDNTFTVPELASRIMIRRAGPDSYLKPVTFRAKAGAPITNLSYFPTSDEYVAVKFVIGDGAEFFISASDTPAMNDVTISVNEPRAVKIYTAYDPANNVREPLSAELSEGLNTVRVPESVSSLYILPANEDATVNAVFFSNGNNSSEATLDDATGAFVVSPVTKGTSVTIDAETKSYESYCTVYVDNADAPKGGVKIVAPAGRKLTLNSGYNTIGFNADENEGYYHTGFTILASDPDTDFTVYVNGVKANVNRDNYDVSAIVELHKGDVIKVYTQNPNPAPLSFSFSISGRAQIENVVTDTDTPQPDVTNGLMVLPGTRVSFSVKLPEATKDSYYTATVKSNGKEINASDSGVYTVYVDEPTEIGVEVTRQFNSIDEIEAADTLDGEAIYFDLQGRRVQRPAAGIYLRKAADGSVAKIIVK